MSQLRERYTVSTRHVTWDKVVSIHSKKRFEGVEVYQNGFVYRGAVGELKITEEKQAVVAITDIEKKWWPSNEGWTKWDNMTLTINCENSLVSEIGGKRIYFTLPRASHGVFTL